MIQAVLFDLDGTLVDTAPDLALALNRLREKHDLSALPFNAIRPIASHGARGLLQLGFNLTPQDLHFALLREELLDLYAENLCLHTTLFDGVETLLIGLKERGLPWGIVTNKPARFTLPLVEQLKFIYPPSSVVSGDTCTEPKPSPASLLYAAKELSLPPVHCLYVGDAERDILAARAANMPAIIARYGYLADTDTPHTWEAQGYIDRPQELIAYLDTPDLISY